MFPVSDTVFSVCDGAHKMRDDRIGTPVSAQHSPHHLTRRAVRAVAWLVLALCLAWPGVGWAAMPIDEPPVGAQSAPRAIQAVSWSGFTPTGWVAAPFASTITASSTTALESGDAYQTSTDGGVTWSQWSTSGLSSSSPVPSTHNITVTGLVFGDSATQNQIRFRVYETGSLERVSPNYVMKVDTTPPASTATLAPPLPASGWYTTSVNIQFAATDLPEDPLNLPLVYTSLNEGIWMPFAQLDVAAEGSQSLRYQARDKADNREPVKTISFGIDVTPPTVSLDADRLPNASGWYTASVTHTLSVSDLVSGKHQGYYRLNDGGWQAGAGFTLATDGIYNIQAYGDDVAGNRSTTVTKEVKVDAAAPVTSRQIDGTPGTNGWYVSDVTVRLLPADNVSGAALTRYRINETDWKTGLQFLLADDGIYNVSYNSVDAAGNVELPVAQQVKIDTAAPAAPTAIQVLPSGWTNVNAFDVTWTAPGDLSGVAGAYYKLGVAPTGPSDGVFVSGSARIEDLAAPADGSHRLYLWLRDGAGNADYTTAPVQGPLLHYDATAPATGISLDGNLGSNGWYRSPVNATLSATDGASGVSALRYRVGGVGNWQLTANTTVTLSFSEAGIYLVEYYAEDVAGNEEAVKTRTVKVDFTAPVPSEVKVTPANGSPINSFRLEWPPIVDLSGVAGAYVRFGSPPSGPADGTFYEGAQAVEGVKAPGEGRHTAYVWLMDAAGNADPETAVVKPDAVCYDVTPPVTVITPTVPSGLNGWYVEPVTFAASATDEASGVREIRHQVDGGAWGSADPFVFGEDGLHTIRISAIDNAGNVEDPAHTYEVAVDRTPPQAAFSRLSSIQSDPSIELNWSGEDAANGSGLVSYDVEVRDGYDAAWEDLLQETTLTTAHFDGQRGHTYFFQVFARDRAGNRQPYGGITRVLIQPVLNGGFDTLAFNDWNSSGNLRMAVVWTEGPDGQQTSAARLGSEEDYGPSLDPPGMVPTDSATISQVIAIPPISQVRRPALTFWYRVLTYDVMYSLNLRKYIDTFDVTLNTVDGQEIALLLRDGNPDSSKWGSLYDTGWKLARIDLRPYAGRTVQLSFANWNRHDNQYNTWSYVDEIRLIDLSRTFVPFTYKSDAGGAAAESEPARSAAVPAVDREGSVR